MEKKRGKGKAKKRKISLRRLWGRLLPFLLALLALALLGVFLSRRASRRVYTAAELSDQAEQSVESSAEYTLWNGRLLRWSRDGVAMLTEDGREQWNEAVTFQNPRLVLQGDYGALGDIEGSRAVIFNKDGVTGMVELNENLLNLSVSGKGVLALILDRGTASYISFYDKQGSPLDIGVNLEMSLSGYPLDLALSPGGDGLLVSTVTAEGGNLMSRLVFYNFTVGQGETNRLVGYFNYEGCLFPELRYLGSRSAVAVSDDRLVFFSLEQEDQPQVRQEIPVQGSLSAVEIFDSCVAAVMTDDISGALLLQVFDTNGKSRFSTELSSVCRRLHANGDSVLAVLDDGVHLWDMSGRERFRGELALPGQSVFVVNSRSLLQADGRYINHYSLR